MIGVVVVTHGSLAEGLLTATIRLAGPLPAVRAVCVNSHEPDDAVAERIAWEAEQVDSGDGVLFLADLDGSTPANLCLRDAVRRPGSAVLFGVNLPMLLKLETANRESAPSMLAHELETTAVRSIHISIPSLATKK